MRDISGVAVATITPLTAGGRELMPDFIEAQIGLLREQGAQGIVPVGSNGEFSSLTIDERKQVLRAAGQARGDLFMLAGAGSCSLPETLDMLEFAASAGADAGLVVPPFYFRDVGAAGLIAYYLRLLEHTPIPILLYNIPMYTGLTITNDIVDALAGHANLAGVKDTGGDPERTREFVERYPDLRIFGGSDSLMGEAVSGGVHGIISGAGNVDPRLIRSLWDARHGDVEGISAAAARVRELRLILTSYPWIAATKHAVSLKGLPESFVRPPLLDLTRSQKRELKRQLREQGFI